MYIAETELNDYSHICVALTNVYGLNKAHSNLICKKLGFSDNFKVSDITNSQKEALIRALNNSNFILNAELKKTHSIIKQKSIDIKLYRGLRRLKGYPVRGQRTRSNAKTAKRVVF